MNKLKTYRGTAFRRAQMTRTEITQQFKPGGQWEAPGFTSSSADAALNKSDFGERNVVFHLTLKTGADLRFIPAEGHSEIVTLPGTRFKIDKVEMRDRSQAPQADIYATEI